MVTFFKLWNITTLLIMDVLAFDSFRNIVGRTVYIFLYLCGVSKAAFNEEVETLPWEPCSVLNDQNTLNFFFFFCMLCYGRPSLSVSQDYRRACEYIFSIDTVGLSIRSDVRKNMAAQPVRA